MEVHPIIHATTVLEWYITIIEEDSQAYSVYKKIYHANK